MFKKKPLEPSAIDLAILDLVKEMEGVDRASDDYAKMAKQLCKLYATKVKNSPKSVSQDTVWLVVGNLVGIALIVGHERASVVASKALAFVRQLR